MLRMSGLRRVLVLSPHTDDAELGCGGTMAKMLDDGVDVHVAVFSTATSSVPEGLPPDTLESECRAAMAKMGVCESNLTVFRYPVRNLNYHRQEVLENLVKLRNRLSPEVVFTPASTDLHQDHQVLFAEGLRAFKTATVLGYELPWNHIDFSANGFAELKQAHLVKKWNSLLEYRSQIQMGRSYFAEPFIWSLARVRGVQIGVEFAEAFQVCRVRF